MFIVPLQRAGQPILAKTKPTENVERGGIGGKIYRIYFSLATPIIAVFGCILFELVAVSVIFFSDVVLKFWIADVEVYVQGNLLEVFLT